MSFLDKLKDINEMRKQAKQIEIMLSQEIVIGKSSNEYIKITLDGNQNIKSVEVQDHIVGDRKEIARHIRESLEDAISKHKKLLQSKFGGMLGQ